MGAVGDAVQGHVFAEGNKAAMTWQLGSKWAAVGAVIGFIDGALHRERILVYRQRG